jgi:hypothetical protein
VDRKQIGSIMDEMDSVTTLFQRVKLDSNVANEYKAAFQEIVRFVNEYRTDMITEHELEVTEALAGPFTQGGLLIVLLEPRIYHPWKNGVYSVIQDCRSLRVMDEGLKFVSQGLLSLTNGVSLLDIRPFFVKKCYPDLDSDVWERLYDLVYEAIKAKKPDVLLCMGNVRGTSSSRNNVRRLHCQEAIDAFELRDDSSKAHSLRHTQVIRAHHPGHFVNYHPQSIEKQQELLSSIYGACNALASKNYETLRKIDFLEDASFRELTFANPNSTSTTMSGLRDCLDILMTLCFQPCHRLPTTSIRPGPFYFLQDWHQRWLERCAQGKTGCMDQARAHLSPVFLELNNCVRKVSWFDPTYEINWKKLSRTFKRFTTGLEQSCYLLASGKETGDVTRIHDGSNFEGDLIDVRVSKIVSHAKHLWESRAHHPKRNAVYVGPFVESL